MNFFRSSQHDRRTKIPTPVSFNNKSLLTSRNADSSRLDTCQDDSYPNPSVNNHEKSLSPSPPDAQSSYPLDKLNQLLNPCDSFSVEDESFSDAHSRKNPYIYKNQRSLDDSLLHSSAHTDAQNENHVRDVQANNSSDISIRVPDFTNCVSAPLVSNHQSSPPSSYRYVSPPSSNGLRRGDYANYTLDPKVPAHILKTCNISSAPRFEPEFLRSSPSQVDTYAREPQWV